MMTWQNEERKRRLVSSRDVKEGREKGEENVHFLPPIFIDLASVLRVNGGER